jgi:L-seryl-tRNA(Ser) seleniumtransferase
MPDLRNLPSVDQLLQSSTTEALISKFGRPLTLRAIRFVLDGVRSSRPDHDGIPSFEELLERTGQVLDQWISPTLQPVINATGVILHTNLGRAPLSRAALQAIEAVSAGYSTLEYDLEKGKRGSRFQHAEDLLRRLTGAEAALVVNNNASAVLLALTALARRRGVIIARSQLIEIGGGFRIPDVLKQSGARLIEVGTTNRVHLSDYRDTLAARPSALVLRAHRSNFQIVGFTSEPGLAEIARVAHEAGVPLVDDLGSGSLLDTGPYGLGHEPTVGESLSAGADLVCFSGDKLLGGPQAGIIVGNSSLIAKLRKHPLTRAVRPDKTCLAALSATLLHYLKDEAEQEIPIWRMISTPVEQIKRRAEYWSEQIGAGWVVPGNATVGGGSLPGETLPTYLLALEVSKPNQTLKELRRANPPIIARIQDEQVVLDPRTVLPEQEEEFLKGIRNVVQPMKART